VEGTPRLSRLILDDLEPRGNLQELEPTSSQFREKSCKNLAGKHPWAEVERHRLLPPPRGGTSVHAGNMGEKC
jgi:hypothetical protein